jgi:hypothetical protein
MGMGLVKCRNCGTLILSSDPVCHGCKAESPVYHQVKKVAHIGGWCIRLSGPVVFIIILAFAFWILCKMKMRETAGRHNQSSWVQPARAVVTFDQRSLVGGQRQTIILSAAAQG